MCSYQSVSDASYGNLLSENWEENLWAHVLSPSSTSSNTSTQPTQDSDGAILVQSDRYVVQDYQTQISTACQDVNPLMSQNHVTFNSKNVDSSSILSPTWENATFEIPETHTNMSTYFSTFNPLSQFQDASVHGELTRNIQNATANRKVHQARINVVPTSNGNFKAIVKRKRKRTVFTTEQLQVLEEVYYKKPYVTREERQILVQQLQVNDKSVKIWFQNRRLKNKRGDDQEMQDDQCSIFDRLDTVESEIKKRTDEFGYVTLDDEIMNDLVNVIDDYFSSNASPVETKTEIDKSPIYEPISPASTCENSCNENGASWQHYEPSEIVQELIDIESIITA